MKKFKYSIFDMDGTLLDSMPAWHNIGKEYLSFLNITPPKNLNEIIAPMSLEESAEYFIERFKINLSVKEIISGVKSLIGDKYKYELKLKPYVKEYLEKLKKDGVIMCVATASPLKLAATALERNGVLEYFTFIASCDEVGVGKNKPDIYYLAASRLNAEPQEIAVYEDADFALITAREAGFYTVGVYEDCFSHKRKDIELISNSYIESFKEVI